MTTLAPDAIPGLTLGDTLGVGGFGSVRRAHHHMLDVDVAVKLIDASIVDEAGLATVLREARLMARLDHPNLLRILDAGSVSGGVYLVLEIMEGGSCRGMRSLPEAPAIAVAKQMLSGLQALHDARILHRDIKPANCLHRPKDGRVKLADLGLAVNWKAASATYDLSGTVPFMAPELLEQPPRFSPLSDLYAAGVSLACLLLPRDPFPAGSFQSMCHWIANGVRPSVARERPDVASPLGALVDRLMAVRPEDRPASAGAALSSLLESPAGRTPPTFAEPEHSTLAPKRATAPTGAPERTVAARIGPWELGETVYSSANWHGRVVTHVHTGKAARLMHLEPSGPLAKQSEFIVSSAARASRLSFHGLIEVLDWGLHDKRAYVVTQPQGRTLRELSDASGPPDANVAVPAMASLAEALAYLHRSGLVYQLLDPGSAVIGGDARTAMLSWPIYCVPAGSPEKAGDGKSRRFLTRAFAAPEVLLGRAPTIEPSVDVYGLGATFCYLLAGKDAYEAARGRGAQPDVRIRSPWVTAPMARLLAELTNERPESRPRADEARDAVLRIERQLGVDPSG